MAKNTLLDYFHVIYNGIFIAYIIPFHNGTITDISMPLTAESQIQAD